MAHVKGSGSDIYGRDDSATPYLKKAYEPAIELSKKFGLVPPEPKSKEGKKAVERRKSSPRSFKSSQGNSRDGAKKSVFNPKLDPHPGRSGGNDRHGAARINEKYKSRGR